MGIGMPGDEDGCGGGGYGGGGGVGGAAIDDLGWDD
jgi:hypothetical protein